MAWSEEDRVAAEVARGLFDELGEIRVRRMFGGAGVFLDATMFAIIHGGAIHLKAEGESAQALRDMGARQFEWTPPSRGRPVRMNYWSLPETALDDPDMACSLARPALGLAPSRV